MNEFYIPYSGFHFHNFFATSDQLRFKYQTYGHPDKEAASKPLYERHSNVAAMYQCLLNTNKLLKDQKFIPDEGGFDWFKPFVPIYFQDPDCRMKRHIFMRDVLQADEEERKKSQVAAVQ